MKDIISILKHTFGKDASVEETTQSIIISKSSKNRHLGDEFQFSTAYTITIPKAKGEPEFRISTLKVKKGNISLFEQLESVRLLEVVNHKIEKAGLESGNPQFNYSAGFNKQMVEMLDVNSSLGLNPGIVMALFQQMSEKISKLEQEVKQLAEVAVRESKEEDAILNVEQAMELLGLRKSTIYTKVNRAEIPHMKRGRRLYFSMNELKNYLREGKRLTDEEVERQAEEIVRRKK